MADLSDVSKTLVQMISGVLYPNGSASPSACGVSVRVFAGWPLPGQLQEQLARNIASVSVYPRQEERNTTRYLDEWFEESHNQPLLQLVISGQTVTVYGQAPIPASNPHHVMLMVNGTPYPYLVQPTDLLPDIAAALASLVAGGCPGTTSSGAIITVPPNADLQAARVGITQVASNEVRRQQRVFQIVIWANSPEQRTAVAKPIDAFLAKTKRFVLPDNSWARLIYQKSPETDASQKEQLYRRDLFYLVEYGTFDTDNASQITQFETAASLLDGGVAQPLSTTYS